MAFALMCVLLPFADINSDTAYAAESMGNDVNAITVQYCGTVLSFDQEPIIKDGRTLVPMRGIFEAMGMELGWDEQTQKVTATGADKTIELTIGDTKAFVNGQEIILDVPAEIMSGRTMVPVRFIAESSGYRVDWCTDNSRKRVVIMPEYSDEVYEAIERYNEECYSEDLLDWIINLHDPETGGFYFKKSAKQTVGFYPDRESTANCLGMLMRLGIFDTSRVAELYGPEKYERFKNWVKEGQSDEDGFWYEEPWGIFVNTMKRDYQTSGATQLLNMIGEKPLYKTNGERLAEQAANKETLAANPIYDNRFNSLKDFEKWFNEGLDWTNPYVAGSTMLSDMGKLQDAGMEFFDQAINLIESRISPNTGHLMTYDPATDSWLELVNYDSMSGTYKISAYYGESTYPSKQGRDWTMPYFDKCMDSTIKVVLSDEEKYQACDIVNPWALLRNLIYSQKDVQGNPDYAAAYQRYLDALPDIIDATTDRILSIKTPDGSYTYYAGYGAAGNKGSNHGLCIADGEMSGAGMIVALYNKVYDTLFMDYTPIWEGKYTFEELKAKFDALEPTKKIQPLGDANFTFNDLELGTLPEGYPIRWSGDVKVVEDPIYMGEYALCLNGPADGTVPVAYFDVGTSSGKGFTLEYDLKIESSDPTVFFMQHEIGSVFHPLKGAFRKENDTYIYQMTTSKSHRLLTTKKGNEYHRIKMVYNCEGDVPVTEFYVDGTLVGTGDYNNGGYPARSADKNISYVGFRGDNRTEQWSVYIDNFKFTEHK